MHCTCLLFIVHSQIMVVPVRGIQYIMLRVAGVNRYYLCTIAIANTLLLSA